MSNIRTYEISHSEQKPLPIKQKGTTDYLLGGRLVMKNGKIDKVLFDGGYAQATSTGTYTDKFAFYYYNQDHLGNNREVVDAKGGIRQRTNYYAFGMTSDESSSSKQPYKYNGKELDRMHGLDTYDYGARQYDPILARWDRIDPLCEKYYSTSPYAYCINNPIRFIDPDGMQIYVNPKEQDTQRVILDFIRDVTGGKDGEYAFNKKGFLYRTDAEYTGNGNGKLIDDAINNEKDMLQITFGDKVPNGENGSDDLGEYCGAAVSPALPLKDKNGNITGDKYVMALDDKYPRQNLSYKDIYGNKLEYDLFDSFIHEMFGHGIPALMHQMGDAIELENEARGKIGRTGRQLEKYPDGSTKHATIKIKK